MTRNVNIVRLIGNVGSDVTLTFTGGGTAVLKISLATTDYWKDKATQEPKERTEWHKVVFYGAVAERAAEQLRKGVECCIEGSNRTSNYVKDNIKRYITEVVVEHGGSFHVIEAFKAGQEQRKSTAQHPARAAAQQPAAMPARGAAQKPRPAPPQQTTQPGPDDWPDLDSFNDDRFN